MATTYYSTLQQSVLQMFSYGSITTDSSLLEFDKANGSRGSESDIAFGQTIGVLRYNGYSSGSYTSLGEIEVTADASSKIGGDMSLRVSSLGGTMTDRITISSAGAINNIASDNSSFIVTGSNKVLTISATGGGASQQLVMNSSGTGASAINITSSGGITASALSPIYIDTTDTTNGIFIGTKTANVPVTLGNAVSQVTIGNNLTVQGALNVVGTLTTISSQTVTITDNLLVLNAAPSGSHDAGVIIQRYQTSNNTGAGDIVSDVAFLTGGTVQSGTDTTHFQLASSVANYNTAGYYVNYWIKFTTGANTNYVRQITAQDSSGNVTVDSALTATPSNGDTFNLYNRNYVGYYFNENVHRIKFAYITTNPGQSNISGNVEFASLEMQDANIDGNAYITGTTNISTLTVSQLVATDSSKNLISIAYSQSNTASTIVQRDSSSNISANTLIANGINAKGTVYTDANNQLQSYALTNGQLIIGSSGNVPVASGITGTTSQIIVTNGAGSITLSTPQNIDITSAPTFTGMTLNATLNMDMQSDIRYYDSGSINYVAFKAPASVTASYTLQYPGAVGNTGQALALASSTVLAWTDFQPLNTGLTTLANLSSNGFVTRTATNNYVSRTFVSGSLTSLTITNADGVSGNPTFTLAQAIDTNATPTFAGLTITSAGISSVGPISLTGGQVDLGGSSDSATINIGKVGNGARTIEIGTVAQANIIKIGSLIGAAATTINAGTGGLTINSTTGTTSLVLGTVSGTVGATTITASGDFTIDGGSNTINIGVNGSDTGNINIGTSTGARNITIGNASTTTNDIKLSAIQIDINGGLNGMNITSSSTTNGIKI